MCAHKRLEVWAAPEILCVHLKRWEFSTVRREKLSTRVVFPLDGLDLAEFVLDAQRDRAAAEPAAPCTVYDLYAVSNHMGSLGSGHYTAYARSASDGAWLEFNDSHVSRASKADVVSGMAYILYYIRRDQRPAEWGAPDTTPIVAPAPAADVQMGEAEQPPSGGGDLPSASESASPPPLVQVGDDMDVDPGWAARPLGYGADTVDEDFALDDDREPGAAARDAVAMGFD